ncbi:MAG TPA: hypothetical protein VKX45_00685 [Bryobacteraceae bacterium]|jgi:uncharacterized protein (TIGR03437 family)|nr:hypothetical protein [Bryobacteraceae bacterium]
MPVLRALLLFALALAPSAAATFGTVVPHESALADLVLDEKSNRLYVVNTSANTVEVYRTNTNPPSQLTSVKTDATPLAIAFSPGRHSLYVACYGASAIDVIDTATLQRQSIALSAAPEAVAVGFNEQVLVSTVGTGTGQSVLVIYDPTVAASLALQSVAVAPPAPAAPVLSPSNMAQAARARLQASADGKTIIGVHEQASNRYVFVYDVASAKVLGSRNLSGISPVLAVSPDGSQFLSGAMLFDSASLLLLGQQNAANSPYVFPATANFNDSAGTQGGAIYAQTPLGAALLTAYNIAPQLNPAPNANTSQLLINTPDNLLIEYGIMLPEKLQGKIAITSDSKTAYAISQSGFTVLPVSTLGQPAIPCVNNGIPTTCSIGVPDSNVALLVSDQCGVTAAQSSGAIPVRSVGGGKITPTVQILSAQTTSPTVRVNLKSYGGDAVAAFSATAARTIGTAAPDQLLIQAPEAVNILPNVRVFQNNRNAEARGTILPADIGATTIGLTDLVADNTRQRLYIANPALNRIEVFDMQKQQFLTPIRVGQLPRAMAIGADGNTLYVANSGSEMMSVVDLAKGAVSGRIPLPPIPFNGSFGIITPQLVASTERGIQVLMSDGSMWMVVNGVLAPRALNPTIFGGARTVPGPQSLAASPEGQYMVLLAGNGTAYLYDSSVDDFVRAAAVIPAPITGYYGPIGAGPGGQYFLTNNLLLNSALTPQNSTATGPTSGGGLPSPTPARPVSAVAAAGGQSYARFSTAPRASASTPPTDAGLVEIVDVTSGRTLASANALEGPLTAAIGTARANVAGRTMAIDPSGSNAYVLTESGLSIIPLTAPAQPAPSVSAGGVVNTANYTAAVAPGGLISVFGKNLAASAVTPGTPLPGVLGGTCVTLNNAPLPLIATSDGQINAQIPPTLAAGRYPLVVHSIGAQAASAAIAVTVAKYAPAIFMDANGAYIFHQDGTRVDQNHPATRDEPLTVYATGLGVTTGGRVTAGMPAPSSPLAVTAPVQLFFGNPTIKQAAVIVDWSGLMPGYIGVYQINARIPGFHLNGNGLPVTLRIGGVNSATSGPSAALVWVD